MAKKTNNKVLVESSIGLPCMEGDKHIFNDKNISYNDSYKNGYFVLERFPNRKIRITFDYEFNGDIISDLIYFVIPSKTKDTEIKNLIISEINSFLSN